MKLSNEDVLCCYKLDRNGSATVFNPATLTLDETKNTLIWLHLSRDSVHAKNFLQQTLQIDALIVEHLFQEDTRPRVTTFGEGLLVNLRGLNFNPGSHLEDMISMRLWLTANLIVSVRKERLMAVGDIKKGFEQNTGPKNTGDFVERLSDHLHDRMGTIVTELEDNIDAVEENELEKISEARLALKDIRMTAIKIRRYMEPQREVLKTLSSKEHPLFSPDNRIILADQVNQITRYLENIDLARDRAKVVQEELSAKISEKMNRNTYFLSIVAAIFLPMSLLTGLFGINVGGIPGNQHPDAFLIFSVSLGVLGLLILGVFILKRWL